MSRVKPFAAGIFANLFVQIVFLTAVSPWLIGVTRKSVLPVHYFLYGCYHVALFGFLSIFLFAFCWLLSRVKQSYLRGMVAGLEALLWMYLILDCAVFVRTGIHLDNPLVAEAFQLKDGNFGIHLSPFQWGALGLLPVACWGLQWAFFYRSPDSKSIFHRLTNLNWTRAILRTGLYATGAAIIFYMYYQGADNGVIPYESLLLRTMTLEAGDAFPRPIPAYAVENYSWKMSGKPDIVMVMSDALRFDMVNSRHTPNLNAIMKSGACAPWGRHYSGSHLTRSGTFALLYGLDSYYYTQFVDTGIRSLPLKILRNNGYRLTLFDSSGISSYVPPIVVPNEFDVYKDYIEESDRALSDQDAVERAIGQLKDDSRPPLYTFVFLYSTHEPYFYPHKATLKPKPSEPAPDSQYQLKRDMYVEGVEHVDALMGKLYGALKSRIENGSAILVFTGDHGEEFGENGAYGHVKFGPLDTLLRVPLVMCGGRVKSARTQLTVHADVWPTIFDAIGGIGSDRSSSIPWLSGVSMLSPSGRTQAFSSEPFFPATQRGLVLLTQDRKYVLRLKGSALDAYDLVEIRDLNEQKIAPDAAELSKYQKQLSLSKNQFGEFFSLAKIR